VFTSKEDLADWMKEQYGDNPKVLVLQSSPTVVNCAAYNEEGTMIDSFIGILNDQGFWEIVTNDKAAYTARMYIAYVGCLIEVLEDVLESNELTSGWLM
jgi:hypothetical protein